MSMPKAVNNYNKEERKKMENKNGKLEQVWSGIGWGLLFILVGSLIFMDNKGWISSGQGWLYFIIGLGGIFILGFLGRYFGNQANRLNAVGGLVVGLALVYIGTAFLYGFGNWWPLALVPLGVGCLIRGIWRNKPESLAR